MRRDKPHINESHRALRVFAGSLSIGLLGICAALAQLGSVKSPPVAPVRPVTDDYFGTQVVDPYRYIENVGNPEVQVWMKSQNDYTRSMLARIPGRQQLMARIKLLDEAAPASVFNVRRLSNGRHFYQKRLASEDVAKLYMRQGITGKERLLLDPARIAASGGKHFSIDFCYPSYDGEYVAVWMSPGGSMESTLHVLDTATALETGEAIDRTWPSTLGWRPDGRSFFYIREAKSAPDAPPTERSQKTRVYLHSVGTDPEKDVAVFGYGVSPKVKIDVADIPLVGTEPGSPYAYGFVVSGTQREASLYVAPLTSVGGSDTPWHKVYGAEDAVTNFALHGDDLYLLTHKDAPRYKIIRTRLSNPDLQRAEVVVPAGEAVVENLAAARDALYVQLLDGGVGRLLRVPYEAKGTPENVTLPFEGAISLGFPEPRVAGILFDITSWTRASKIYAYDPQIRQVSDTRLQPSGPFDDPPNVVSAEVKARSHDGTMIPLSIVHKRGLKLNGTNPTLLRGYGAYGSSLLPSFEPKFTAWLERGGVLAIAHVRGGGEYGDEWYKAGMQLTKPNTWRDFIACAEYLIKKGYTSPARLAGWSYSGGGIMIGRALTERPDLLRAAVVRAGVFDTVRFELTPNGVFNTPEFGSAKTAEGFKGLLAMSTYNSIVDGARYPAVMAITSMNDTNVEPWQTAKMIARLQAATASGRPILLRLDEEGGHGIAATKTQEQMVFADQLAFLFWQLGIPEYQIQ